MSRLRDRWRFKRELKSMLENLTNEDLFDAYIRKNQ